ncbi:phosphatidylinositol 4-phosphate 3-kinase C2 domain-containing subunit alpha-like isoform X3 [Mercenaria mercenaria]|uniref:phosphatidylinositol 4-phosphate 3-kinase C2 domain-containing subunit alpha-like isoform X3 n=1 Tax=Mercenaria mercenaria TaxID=6596 RepID=UPI00234EA14E|nr:phosphatidylinositol 4-phosphate 3-kinase C2 domain-containing subunit alpha-like isoform X3 [Mercenaria mercenaria]
MDRASGNRNEAPPPVPPRTWMGRPGHTMSLPYGTTLDGYQSGSNIGTRSSQSNVGNVRPQSISILPHSTDTTDPRLISLSPPGNSSSFQAQGSQGASFFSDLEGLDFTASKSEPNEAKTAEPNIAGGPKIYPDIRAAFRELNQPNNTGSEWGSRQLPGSNRNSMPSPYGWDQSLSQMAAGGFGTGSTSVPTTPLPGTYTQTGAGNLVGYNLGNQFPAQNPNFYAGLPGNAFSSTAGANTGPVNTAHLNRTVSDTASSGTMSDGFNLVPNVDFDAWSESDFFNQQAAGGNQNDQQAAGSENSFKTHRRNNSDLIQLGFEGVMTSEEKEYFSLEYFDPLHKRGRTMSVSTPSSMASSNYFFAKPPEEAVVSKDRNDWVTFDDGDFEFGRSDNTDMPDEFIGAKTDQIPSRPDMSVDDSKVGHEKLRKKLYIDEESDAFCQMVAELKNEYKSTDERTNLGFIVSPMCNKQQEPMSVKIVVHSEYATEPLSFTSDVHSLVEHVINHILYSCLTGSMPSYMLESLKSVDFILKVNDRSEYLLNEYPLSKYSYTHDCLKMDQDLCFRIMRRQDVALPFLRTIDDDNQQLYFPQDHVRDTEVTRDSLEILMDTFYKEVEKVTDLVLKDEVEHVQFQSLSQSVKAICNILSKIETIDIAKCLSRVESLLKQMKNSIPAKSSTLEHNDGGYATLQRGSMKVSHIPQLEEALESLVTATIALVRIYCQAFHTDFHLGKKIDQPWDIRKDGKIYKYPQDVTGSGENFIVQICTVHRIPPDWGSRFDEYKMETELYHGKRKLGVMSCSTCASVHSSGLVPLIVWDEWLTHDIQLCLLPRETRLCITLVGVKNLQTGSGTAAESQRETTALGGVTIQLFNRRGYLLQGSQLVPLQMNFAADPVTPFCSTLQPDSALLQFNLPDFGKQIVFSEPLNMSDFKKKTFMDLAPEVREEIQEVMKKDCVTSCTGDQLEILWNYRQNLHDYPGLLPWILQAAPGWDWACLPEIYAQIKQWSTLQPMQSLELLLPQYPDMKVRSFAVDCLRMMPTDDLIAFIPQLIQALKYESYHSSPLARLMLEQSCRSVRFAHQFFWLLKGATQDSQYKRRYELMFVALVSVAGEALYQEFMKQEEIVKVLQTTAERVQQAKGSEKENTLRKNLEILYEIYENKHKVLLPHNPGYEVSGIEMNSCSFFTSNAVPLKLVFKNATENVGPVYAMFKVGDDLRQDMMTMQVVQIMDHLWLKEGLDLKMITFSCLPTGPRRGFIEIITESDTLRKIQVMSGVTGSFKDRVIKDWLQKHNPTELDYQKAVENFTRSCAGYCVATYVLGVCDRHNDNIMVKQTGHLFHIDFNKILGDAQMFGNIKRDRVKFVLTSDMAYVINDGDRQSDRFQHFIDMCVQAFNILRKHANLFINLFSLMLRSGIPGITEKGVEFVQRALLPGLTDTQATAMFTRMIQESLSAKSTQFNFFIHNLAQMKFSSHNEGALLSFVPKVYSQQTDGKIKYVEVFGIQKRYTPEKHYIYTLKIERENQRVPTYIFRIFSEFVEFRNKLAAEFPLVNWPPLQGRISSAPVANIRFRWVLLGRSHIKAVAENRKSEIERFLQDLFSASGEIVHCELVYTFFHPLLRDEQEAQKERLALPKLREEKLNISENPILVQSRQGQVKLSLEYVKDTLHIMIMHAKDLPMVGSELPSPYVKTYLLPDPDKQTKRKTKVVKDSTHPTYNEVIEYRLSRDIVRQKMLQVTIWDYDVLRENPFLGAVYVKLRDIDFTNTVSQWYRLEKLQITDTNML